MRQWRALRLRPLDFEALEVDPSRQGRGQLGTVTATSSVGCREDASDRVRGEICLFVSNGTCVSSVKIGVTSAR